jgi:hypothetical protein
MNVTLISRREYRHAIDWDLFQSKQRDSQADVLLGYWKGRDSETRVEVFISCEIRVVLAVEYKWPHYLTLRVACNIIQ